MQDNGILYETNNLYLNPSMEIVLNGHTHGVVVGKAKSLDHAKRVMGRLESSINNLRRMYGHS